MNILKSIGAVLAGMIFIVATHTITDKILESAGIFPPPEQGLHVTWMLVTALVYRVLFQVAGSFITASLAPSSPFQHGMIIGVIGLILGSVAAVVTIPMNLSPAWYPIALAVSAIPSAWLGATIHASLRAR